MGCLQGNRHQRRAALDDPHGAQIGLIFNPAPTLRGGNLPRHQRPVV